MVNSQMKVKEIDISTQPVLSERNADHEDQSKRSKSRRYAEKSLDAATMSAILTESYTKPTLPSADFKDVADALSEVISVIQNGDMNHIEAMLIGQA